MTKGKTNYKIKCIHCKTYQRMTIAFGSFKCPKCKKANYL